VGVQTPFRSVRDLERARGRALPAVHVGPEYRKSFVRVAPREARSRLRRPLSWSCEFAGLTLANSSPGSVATWAFSSPAHNVTQDHPVYIPRGGSPFLGLVLGAARRRCCTLLPLRHEAQCYIARAAGRDERRYLWI
jgi:hypothetical protein